MINKVDLPAADISGAIKQIKSHFDFDPEEIIHVS